MSGDGHVFISYKNEDEAFAEELRGQLQAWEYETWMYIHDVPPGSYLPDEIDQGLRAAGVVVGVMSPRSVESRPVKNEWDWAIVNRKRLILLMLEKCDVPSNYISIFYIDFTTDKSKGFKQLQAALAAPESTQPADPYEDYLQRLYERINTFLAQKIIARLDDDEMTPEPLRLRSERTANAVDALFEKRDKFDPLFAIGGIEQDEPEQVYDDFERAFEYYEGRVLLLGEPGAGKTITLLHFGRDAVVRRMQDSSLPLPILGIVPTWDSEKRPSMAAWLSESYGAPGNCAQVIEEGKALLLLDGLDELGGEREENPHPPTPSPSGRGGEEKRRYDPRQRFFQIIPENNQLVLTCRVKDYEEIGEKIALKGAVTLKPLDDGQMRAYLAEQGELWAAVQADEGLREMLRTPLLLSFFAFAYRDMYEDERRQLRDLSDSPGDLRDKIFEAYVRGRYEHEERKPHTNVTASLELIYEVLGYVGMADASVQGGNTLTRTLFLYSLGEEERTERFIELATRLHLLAPGEDNPLRFIHLLLRDYFAFHYAVKELRQAKWYSGNRPYSAPNPTRALRLIGDVRAVEPLIDALNDLNSFVRESAALALGFIGDARAVEPLMAALRDPEGKVRHYAASALGEIGDARAVERLIAALRDLDWNDQGYAVSALLEIGSAAVEPLIAALRDPEPEVRDNAAFILGEIRDARAVPGLIASLSDTQEVWSGHRVSDRAAEALERIGTPEALEAVARWRREQGEEKG